MIDSQEFNEKISTQTTPEFGKTYLFYGQTAFLSEESAQLLVQSAKRHGFSQRDIFYIDNRSKFKELINSMQSPGLFEPKKIIELRFDTDKPSKKIGERIAEIAAHKSDNILIIQASGLSYKYQKEKWFTAIVQQATAVVSKPIYANQLPNWIHQRALQQQLQLSSEALKIIMRFSEGNLLWTNQILMQLSHSDYEQPISGEVVESMLADMSVFQIDDLHKAIFSKNNDALKISQRLEQENESLVYITSVLYREFDTLRRLCLSDLPFSKACQQLRIWQSKQSTYKAALKHYKLQHISSALQQFAELDKINKGQHKGDGWLLINRIITELLFAA